jgi:hypothetical protein
MKETMKEKILFRFSQSKETVFLRSDFKGVGSASQIDRLLNKLITSGHVLKITRGVYVKARINSITGKTTVATQGGFKQAIIAALNRLNIEWLPSEAALDYNSKKTNQIPANLQIRVPKGFKREFKLGTYHCDFLKVL